MDDAEPVLRTSGDMSLAAVQLLLSSGPLLRGVLMERESLLVMPLNAAKRGKGPLVVPAMPLCRGELGLDLLFERIPAIRSQSAHNEERKRWGADHRLTDRTWGEGGRRGESRKGMCCRCIDEQSKGERESSQREKKSAGQRKKRSTDREC